MRESNSDVSAHAIISFLMGLTPLVFLLFLILMVTVIAEYYNSYGILPSIGQAVAFLVILLMLFGVAWPLKAVLYSFIWGVLTIIVGLFSLRAINKSSKVIKGKKLSIMGIILGCFWIGCSVFLLIFYWLNICG